MITVSMPQSEFEEAKKSAAEAAASLAGRNAQIGLANCVVAALEGRWEQIAYVGGRESAPVEVTEMFQKLKEIKK